jgi:ATPase subunit of ABC transporter with duplicated ATPase domains
VATRIWYFHGGKVEDFKGTYEEFVADQEARAAQDAVVPARASARRAPVPS